MPWRALWVLLPLGAFAAAAPPVLRTVWSHPYFAVAAVVIHHRGRLPAADLRAALGITQGESIWGVDPGAAEARLRARPWVRSASVRRELPDRVVVRVREYLPAAIVVVGDAQPAFYYVAANGRIFAPVGVTDGRDLPYITGLVQSDLDGHEGFGPQAVHRALGLLRLVGREVGGIGAISEVHADREQGLTLLPERPAIPIVLGWGALPRKLDRLARVLPLWAGRAPDVREISCIFDDEVIVRLREPLPGSTPGAGAAGA